MILLLSANDTSAYTWLHPTPIVLRVNVWSRVQAVSVTMRMRIVRQQKPLASMSVVVHGRRPALELWFASGAVCGGRAVALCVEEGPWR